MIEGAASSKLYFDANVFIYAVEGSDAAMPRLPDAIHVATAVRAGCARMLSFDQALKLPEGMHRVTRDGLPQLIAELS